jgi:hypothetical protein
MIIVFGMWQQEQQTEIIFVIKFGTNQIQKVVAAKQFT